MAISVILVSGLALGGIVAEFFNPWVVQLSVRNVDGAFDLNSLKSLQMGLRSLGRAISDEAYEPDIAKKVGLKLEAPNWIEQNVTPEFSVSKSDLRSSNLPDQAQQALGQSAQFTYLTIKVTDGDAFKAEQQAKLIASAASRLSMREQFLDILSRQSRAIQTELEKDTSALPDLRLKLDETDHRLALAKDIAERLPEDARGNSASQFSLRGQGTNGDLDQTIFLPIETQVKGLQIQSGLQEALIDQLSFKVTLHQWLERRISEASSLILADRSMSTYASDLTQSNYWDAAEILNLPANKTDKWKAEYAQSSVQPILSAAQAVLGRFKLLGANSYVIIARPAYSTGLLVALGLLMALLGIAALAFIDFLRSKSSVANSGQ
jgi:hypothetical protein